MYRPLEATTFSVKLLYRGLMTPGMHITAVKTPNLKVTLLFLLRFPHKEDAETFPKRAGIKTKESEYKKASVSSAERFKVWDIAECFVIWYSL